MTNSMNANIRKETRKAVYKRDGYRCALCDSTDGLQIHHVKPRGKGGSDHPMNLITLCWRCHAAAHGSIMSDAYATMIQPNLADETLTVQEQIAMQIELDCVAYVSDYYAEQGDIWYPWDG